MRSFRSPQSYSDYFRIGQIQLPRPFPDPKWRCCLLTLAAVRTQDPNVFGAKHSAGCEGKRVSWVPVSPFTSNEPDSKAKGIRRGKPNPGLGYRTFYNYTWFIHQPFSTWNPWHLKQKGGCWDISAHPLSWEKLQQVPARLADALRWANETPSLGAKCLSNCCFGTGPPSVSLPASPLRRESPFPTALWFSWK